MDPEVLSAAPWAKSIEKFGITCRFFFCLLYVSFKAGKRSEMRTIILNQKFVGFFDKRSVQLLT